MEAQPVMDAKLFTIGFTQKSAREFFEKLRQAGVKRVIDVRLNNRSQLAGFAKQDDLAYFLKELGGMDYIHLPELAPTQEMLDAYRKDKGSWADYEQKFLKLIKQRRIEETVSAEMLQQGCLLCSEHLPHRCHRRLVAEYLKAKLGSVEIQHLL